MIDTTQSNNIQQTIATPLAINGVGLHSGQEVSMKFLPADIDYGIKFK